ncbi:hypothetical protein ABTX81_30215 [Kitasatospora sp. NPDC097605]|uniref:hypothetical protein n=1 Tax=Kitasatospora sp. NPDC097605 TaxID=3157226 RepID=UPI003333D009
MPTTTTTPDATFLLDAAARQSPTHGDHVAGVIGLAMFHAGQAVGNLDALDTAALYLTHPGRTGARAWADPDGTVRLAGWIVANWVEIRLSRHPDLDPDHPLIDAVQQIITTAWNPAEPTPVRACMALHRAARTWATVLHDMGLHRPVTSLSALSAGASREVVCARLAAEFAATAWTYRPGPDLGHALLRIIEHAGTPGSRPYWRNPHTGAWKGNHPNPRRLW